MIPFNYILTDGYALFSTDKITGGFGFLNPDEALVAFVYFALAGFWGVAGYVISLLFFSPVIVSASILFEPFVSQMIGYWMDIDRLPGWLTWVGTVITTFGILSI